MKSQFWKARAEPDYCALQTVNEKEEQQIEASTAFNIRSWVLLGLLALGSAVIGFVGGIYSQNSVTKTYGLLNPPGTVHQTWEHNLTFSAKPSPETEKAWSSLVPIGRGFVHHPHVAPFISNIAVFHQLHCLHGIRVTYYMAFHESQVLRGEANRDQFLEDMGVDASSVHIRHCFDYLRRALMCASDTNLEHVSEKTHTTSGWGSDKVCRDYWDVLEWAEKYANSSDVGIL